MPENNSNNTTIETAEEPNQGKLRQVFFYALSIKSLILVPVFLLLSLLIFLLTSDVFYTSILSRSDLVSTFVKAKKWGMDARIREEIEDKTQLESFRREYEKIKNDFEDKKEFFARLNRTVEYDRLELQRKELSKLSWKKAPDVFKSEDEFKKYRKEELGRLDALIDEIDAYRKDNKSEISQAEDDLDDAEEAFEDSRKLLEEKDEQARRIVLSHENSLTGKIYADLDTVSPVLTRELNERIIDGPVKDEIGKFISFMTSYDEQVAAGNVYRNPFNINIPSFQERVRVVVPEIRVSLWVEDEVNGIRQKRHLLSEIFVEKIGSIPGLKTKDMFVNLFRFSESGMGESVGRSYLGKAGLSIRDGVIVMERTELAGRTARIMEKAMIAATYARYAKYALAAAALALLVVLAAYPTIARKKRIHVSRVLIYPSVAMMVLTAGASAASWMPERFFPTMMSDPLINIYAGEILFVLCLHLALPVAALFGLLLAAGIALRISAGPAPADYAPSDAVKQEIGGAVADSGSAGQEIPDA